jgi:uncharacterized membrane protein YkvA (DUF1232 family)
MKVPSKEDIISYFMDNKDKFRKASGFDIGVTAASVLVPVIGIARGISNAANSITNGDEARLIDYLSKHYNELNRATVQLVVCSLISIDKLPKDIAEHVKTAIGYLYTPMDLIPDIIPTIGRVDDIVVLRHVCSKARQYFIEDIEKLEISFMAKIIKKSAKSTVLDFKDHDSDLQVTPLNISHKSDVTPEISNDPNRKVTPPVREGAIMKF